jgi:hypothetical protein
VIRVVLGVMLGVQPCRVLMMLGGMQLMTLGHMRMMRHLMVLPRGVRLVRFPMMMRSGFQMLGGDIVMLVMLCHDYS